ncbi:MAG: RNA polymerase sigma factor [Vicinamibacteria bacterium]
MGTGETSLGGSRQDFPKTAGDMLSQARDPSTRVRRAGFEELSKRYWKPVYHYVRVAWAKSNEDAKDLTQAFFLWLLEGDSIARYEQERASFRTYLKLLLKRFVGHQDEAMNRLKRGGGVRIVALDDEKTSLKGLVPDPGATDPERVFDQEWRTALIRNAVEQVRSRWLSDERAVKFQAFEHYDLSPPDRRPTYSEVAERLGLKESDVRNHLFAVREAIRAELRSELSDMTSGPEELAEEWNAFFGS